MTKLLKSIFNFYDIKTAGIYYFIPAVLITRYDLL